ncbi:MAG: hypothetical protein ACPGU3_07855 [Litorivicinus sp.]
MSLLRNQSGFALPFVLLLGLGLTYVVAELVRYSSGDVNAQANINARNAALQGLTYAQDRALSLLRASSALPIASASIPITGCLEDHIGRDAKPFALDDENLDELGTYFYAAEAMNRQVAATNISALEPVDTNLPSNGGNATLEIWFLSPQAQSTTLIQASGAQISLVAASGAMNLSIPGGMTPVSLGPGQWHLLRLQKVGSQHTVTVGPDNIWVEDFDSSIEAEWLIDGSGGGSPLYVAVARGWGATPPAPTLDNAKNDYRTPGSVSSIWQLPMSANPTVLTAPYDPTSVTRYAPPSTTEQYRITTCNDNHHRVFWTERSVNGGVVQWR